MKRYFLYLFVYSVGGFILERIINLIFLGAYVDNSVMVGFYQPLYGVGIVLAILLNETLIIKQNMQKVYKHILLVVTAIITTAFSEFIHGELYEFFTGGILWDYGQTFSCSYPYVCLLPTSLFGIISYLAIIYLHPVVDQVIKTIPTYLFWIIVSVFTVDAIYTFFTVLL